MLLDLYVQSAVSVVKQKARLTFAENFCIMCRSSGRQSHCIIYLRLLHDAIALAEFLS